VSLPKPQSPQPLRETPAPPRETPGPLVRTASRRAPIIIAGAALSYAHVAVAGLIIVGLCVLFYLLGLYIRGGEGLPATPVHPTMSEIRQQPPTPGLVVPPIERPAPPSILGQQPGGAGPGPAEKPGGPKPGPLPGVSRKPGPAERPGLPGGSVEKPTASPFGPMPPVGPAERPGGIEKPTGPQKPVAPEPPPPAGPRWRVRIATFDIGQPSAVDELRDFLQQDGVETEDLPGRGVHVLYSKDQFADKKKAEEFAAKINKQMETFQKKTRHKTSRDARPELVKE
jgi:hypothetical protein